MATPTIRGTASATFVGGTQLSFSASNYNTPPVAGDLLVLAANTVDYYVSVPQISISSGTGWTSRVYAAGPTGSEVTSVSIWTRVATGNSSDNVILNSTSGDPAPVPVGIIIAISNVASISVGTFQSSTSTAASPASDVTVPALGVANDLELIFQSGGVNQGAWTQVTSTPTGFTQQAQQTTTNGNTSVITCWSKVLSANGTATTVKTPTYIPFYEWQVAGALALTAPTPLSYNLIVSPS
jgi:hypothetical protein